MAAPTLLIVDDARLARLMVRSLVSRLRPDLLVIEAGDAAQAIDFIKDVPQLDFATIDYNMPGMNGLDLASALKAKFPEARLALLTANVQGALRRRTTEAGIEFLDKPVSESKMSAFLAQTGPV